LFPPSLTCQAINGSLNQIGFHLNNEIKVVDFATALAILITLVSLLLSLKKDRNMRQRDQADKIRSAAAKTLAKLDKWREISLSMFDSMDIVFVDVSKAWAKGIKGDELRDNLWEKLNKLRVDVSEEIIKQGIETTYFELYSSDPYVKLYFEKVLNTLKDEQEVMFRMGLLPGVQNIVNQLENVDGVRETAYFRNPLMEHAVIMRGRYQLRINDILSDVSDAIFKLLKKKDGSLLKMEKDKTLYGRIYEKAFMKEKDYYFKNLLLNVTPGVAEDYGIILKKNARMIRSTDSE
jgi:hypothetical protein